MQNHQVGDGDVCRQLVLPLYAVFPRLLTCPTMLSERLIQGRVRAQPHCALQGRPLIFEQFPLTLYRPPYR